MHGTTPNCRLTPLYTASRQAHGKAWRQHLRRHAPAPATIPPFARQRVHNVYHHLADMSLPYDLWTEEAEFAAIVHLLGKYEKGTAARIHVETVQAYLAFSRRFEPAVPKYSEREAYATVWRIAAIRELLPRGTSDADVYATVLDAVCEEQDHACSRIAV